MTVTVTATAYVNVTESVTVTAIVTYRCHLEMPVTSVTSVTYATPGHLCPQHANYETETHEIFEIFEILVTSVTSVTPATSAICVTFVTFAMFVTFESVTTVTVNVNVSVATVLIVTVLIVIVTVNVTETATAIPWPPLQEVVRQVRVHWMLLTATAGVLAGQVLHSYRMRRVPLSSTRGGASNDRGCCSARLASRSVVSSRFDRSEYEEGHSMFVKKIDK